jgi:hypothetical protein
MEKHSYVLISFGVFDYALETAYRAAQPITMVKPPAITNLLSITQYNQYTAPFP